MNSRRAGFSAEESLLLDESFARNPAGTLRTGTKINLLP